MNRKFELSLGISVRLLAVIALLAVTATGVSFVVFQSTRTDVAALTEDVDGLNVSLVHASDSLGQTDQAQSEMLARLDILETTAEEYPRFAVANFALLVDHLSVQLSSDAGVRRDAGLNEIRELVRRYGSRMISQSSFMNDIGPLQVEMLADSVDAEMVCLEAMSNWQRSDATSVWKDTLGSVKNSLIRMDEESQNDLSRIAVLQNQLELVMSYIDAALLLRVRDATASVADAKGYDFVIDSASVIQVIPSNGVPDITEEVKGFLE